MQRVLEWKFARGEWKVARLYDRMKMEYNLIFQSYSTVVMFPFVAVRVW